MKCIEVEKKIDAFFDGEIVSPQEIETHLENCVSCRTTFENISAVRRTLKQNFKVSAPPLLGENVLSAFQNFHEAKRREKVETKQTTQKIGWFGIPRFTFAAALILFALATITAFQIGRMSASNIVVAMPQAQENNISTTEKAKINPTSDENPIQIKYIEVPVVQEKIVKVPVVQEKIVTRIIYKNINIEDTKKSLLNSDKTEDFTVSSRLKDNRYSTQINLKGFQIVSDLKPQIIKGDENEK